MADFEALQPLLERALARESGNLDDTERATAAQGMARAADMLADTYTLVITNVPYLGQRDQGEVIRTHLAEHFKDAKADLSVAFIERILNSLSKAGTLAIVTPQNWLFLRNYKRLREKLLKHRTWLGLAKLGEEAWNTFGNRGPNTALILIRAAAPDLQNTLFGVDVSTNRDENLILIDEKKSLLRGADLTAERRTQKKGAIRLIRQTDQLEKPGSVITLEDPSKHDPLSKYAYSHQGASTIDVERFRIYAWEAPLSNYWKLHLSTPQRGQLFTGNSYFSASREDGSAMHETAQHMRDAGLLGGWLSGKNIWGKRGVACSSMHDLQATIYCGPVFDNMASVIIPDDQELLPALWAFCSSPEFHTEVRKINQKIAVANATLTQVPFDIERWKLAAAQEYPNGLPEPQSDDPTQWLFHGHPVKAVSGSVLQVAVSRLLGYQWPPELDPTICQAAKVREWVARCNNLKEFADDDGIVCLSATRGESAATDRLRKLLAAAFGNDWSVTKERELLKASAGEGKNPATSLDAWLRDKFFEEHCRLFNHRPFIWHIWDGNLSGFHCLVNAHKLAGPDGEGRRTLEAITYSYLGGWVDRQKDNQKAMVEGADAHLASAQDLQKQLEKILEGEPPYDKFVRWKPLHEQAIGWDPDINDGVRLNIRPFMNAELRKGGKKGAGILRWKPNIKWTKDRGKEPQSLRPKEDFPWFWGCNGDGSESDVIDYTDERAARAEFDGNRWNNLHYSAQLKKPQGLTRRRT